MTRTNLIRFIDESNKIEGIFFGAEKQVDAYEEFLSRNRILVEDLERFVSIIEPGAKLRREYGMTIHAGKYAPPPGGPVIYQNLKDVLRIVNRRQPEWAFRQHVLYEKLHPFLDCNGRSGRVLWLWQMGGESELGFLHKFYYQSLRGSLR